MIILICARNAMWLFPGLNAVCILICGHELETRLTPCGQKSGQIQDLPFKPSFTGKIFSLFQWVFTSDRWFFIKFPDKNRERYVNKNKCCTDLKNSNFQRFDLVFFGDNRLRDFNPFDFCISYLHINQFTKSLLLPFKPIKIISTWTRFLRIVTRIFFSEFHSGEISIVGQVSCRDPRNKTGLFLGPN